MLENFYSYFKTIEMTDALINRVESLCTGYANILPAITNVFVTDGYDGNGIRRYQNLWLFSGNTIMELKRFIELDNIDFVNLACKVRWIQFVKTELESLTGATSTKSRLNVQIVFGEWTQNRPNAEFDVAHNNCPFLVEIINTMFMPNLG